MKCPRCKEGVDAGLSHCPYCRVELLGAYEERAFEVQAAEAAERSRKAGVAARRRKARRAAWAAAASACAAALFGFFSWRSAVPRQLAVVPPPGWRAEAPPPRGRWSPVTRLTDGLSVIDLFEADAGLDAAAAAAQAFDDPMARVESRRIVVVGGVESVAFRISGGRAYMPSAASGTVQGGSLPAPKVESQALSGALIVVPARGRMILIRGVTGEGNAAALQRALDALCAGLRL